MQKTLLTGLLSILVVGPAVAEIDLSTMTPEEMINTDKSICLKHHDTHYWVGNDNVCVPLDACNDADYKARYCDKDRFFGIRVSGEQAKKLVNLRAEAAKLDCKAADVIENQVRCMGRDYRTFKFKEIGYDLKYTNPYNTPDNNDENYKAGQCFALGGKYVDNLSGRYFNDYESGCWYAGCLLLSKNDCDKFGGEMQDFSCEMSFDLYTNDTFPQEKHVSQSVCAAGIAAATTICIIPGALSCG